MILELVHDMTGAGAPIAVDATTNVLPFVAG